MFVHGMIHDEIYSHSVVNYSVSGKGDLRMCDYPFLTIIRSSI